MPKIKMDNRPLPPAYKKYYKDAKTVGIKSGYNKLYRLFKQQNKQNIMSFHLSLVPDNLHTLSKGFIEYCISWTMCCLLKVKDTDKDNFGSNITQLDNRIKKFPTIQSLTIFSNKYIVRFINGISHLFKTSWNKKKTAGNRIFCKW